MAQITAQMVGRRAAPRAKRAGVPVGSVSRWAGRQVPILLLGGAILLAAVPDPAWWAQPLAVAAGLGGAYLAGRAGYGAPGAEALLLHEMTRLEARERDLTRVLVGAALADVPAVGGAPERGDGAAAAEPRPSAGLRSGGRPGLLRAVPGGDPLDGPLDDDEAGG